MWVTRHAVASALVAMAVAIVAGVFAFARPQYRPEIRNTNYDMTHRTHYTVQQVRVAFAVHGFRFQRSTVLTSHVPGTYMWSMSSDAGPDVAVFGPRSKVSWGHDPKDALNVVTGNVGVTYYGNDEDVVDRVHAAIRDLGKSQ